MYNPYNWEIRREYKFSQDSIKRKYNESDYDYYHRLLTEFAKWSATKSVVIQGIELAQMNLNDSIAIEKSSENQIETIQHDIAVLQRKIEEYAYITKNIKIIR